MPYPAVFWRVGGENGGIGRDGDEDVGGFCVIFVKT